MMLNNLLNFSGLERDGCKMGAASVVYTSVKAACQAVVALHGKSIGGGVVWARQQGGEVCGLNSRILLHMIFSPCFPF